MLKLQHFFILVSFLVVTSLVACDKDEESPEPQGGSQVSGGQVQGGSSDGGSAEPQDDMGLQGGEAVGGQSAGSDLDQEQLSGGAESDLPVEGGQQSESQGGELLEEDCVDAPLPGGSADVEVEESCLPEGEDLPVEGGAQESEDSAQEDEASSEQSEG